GTPTRARAVSQYEAGRDRTRSAIELTTVSRLAIRPALVASRSSAARPASPSARAQLFHWLSLPTAITIGRSAAWNNSYGTRFACALPHREAFSPDTSAFCATFTNAATAL